MHDYRPTFIDVFAGCGGLSLGLMRSGMRGLFAIEKDDSAFATLQSNLIDKDHDYRFEWPTWLPEEALSIEDILSEHYNELSALKGKVDLLAGGPPCQGFSTAGRRRADDPRNSLFKSYVELVQIIEPKVVLMENVRGFTMDFRSDEEISNYAQELRDHLSSEYRVFEKLIDVSEYGVPQRRVRYFLIAIKPELKSKEPFLLLERFRDEFLRSINLQTPVSAWSAISDLETVDGSSRASEESAGFHEIVPGEPKTRYQKIMADEDTTTTDLRLARHRPEIAARFKKIIELCHAEGRLNTSVGREIRDQFGLKKQALRVLDPDAPAPTITSMPDDLLHYKEPRTLSVRENARLQSIPDWFEFKGKYTTGGHRRRIEVPRFTQVANAVPPLIAQAIGDVLNKILSDNSDISDCGDDLAGHSFQEITKAAS